MEDVHEETDERGLGIVVGVQGVRHPVLVIGRDGDLRECLASIDVQVYLRPDVRGIHMSRILRWLGEFNPIPIYGPTFEMTLRNLAYNMSADSYRTDVQFTAKFRYPIVRKSPETGLQTTNYCDAEVQAIYGVLGLVSYTSLMEVPVFTVCPCSLSMCDGRAAHTQRCYVRAVVEQNFRHLWEQCVPLEDIYDALTKSGSATVYSTLKRPDEKSVVQAGFDNPKFVEDVVRDAVIELRSVLGFKKLEVNAWSQESIHPHNVVATAKVKGDDEIQNQDQKEKEEEKGGAASSSS